MSCMECLVWNLVHTDQKVKQYALNLHFFCFLLTFDFFHWDHIYIGHSPPETESKSSLPLMLSWWNSNMFHCWHHLHECSSSLNPQPAEKKQMLIKCSNKISCQGTRTRLVCHSMVISFFFPLLLFVACEFIGLFILHELKINYMAKTF